MPIKTRGNRRLSAALDGADENANDNREKGRKHAAKHQDEPPGESEHGRHAATLQRT